MQARAAAKAHGDGAPGRGLPVGTFRRGATAVSGQQYRSGSGGRVN
jgi:hypothetical protein